MKVSVALCTYNGEMFLEEQLRSIFNQTQPVDEVIICDDHSTDGTAGIIRKFADSYPDKIIFFSNETNVGPVKNFENCIGLCSGDIIFLSDQDDVWYKNKAERLLDVFKRDEEALLVFTNANLIDDSGKMMPGTLWEKWGFTEELQNEWLSNTKAIRYLIRNNMITGATVAFKKELKQDIFPFELPKNYWHDAWLGIIAAGFNGLRFAAEPTIKYRVHRNQQIGIGNSNSIATGDTKLSSYITIEELIMKVSKKFPQLSKYIVPAEVNLIKRTINKARSFLNKAMTSPNNK